MNAWRDSIGEAIEGLDRLLYLLNTTLDVAEGQAGALPWIAPRWISLRLSNSLCDLYQPAMAERRHEPWHWMRSRVVVDADLSLLHRVIEQSP